MRAAATAIAWMAIAIWFGISPCRAYTPESPEVQRLVDIGIESLQTSQDHRLGAHCLAAMALRKTGSSPAHPKVQSAIKECRKALQQSAPYEDVYSNGLAVIFLVELDVKAYRKEIDGFLASLYQRQKPHGGWGYEGRDTGDTSQTQYGVLALWSAHQHGIAVQAESVRRALLWLMRTQDPSGGWGYQGKDPGSMTRTKQTPVNCSMFAAGFGSTLMCAHMLGVLDAETMNEREDPTAELPPAVKPVTEVGAAETLPGGEAIDKDRLLETIELGNNWINRNYQVEIENYNNYYLYATERFRSFEELITGEVQEEPSWYDDGVEYLERTLNGPPDPHWFKGCGRVADTSFAVLFLIRSTRKSIQSVDLGTGLLVGGRGLPADLAKAKVRRGRVVADEATRSIQQLLTILENPDHPQHADLLASPRGLKTSELVTPTENDVPRLERIIRGGEPVARLVAVQTLSRRRNLDDVPVLLYAMSDPDRRVVLAARDGLRALSWRPDGFGLREDYTNRQRLDALEAWKAWYRRIRPRAPLGS